MKYERKFRGMKIPWHLAHDYEVMKFPFVDWKVLRQYRRGYNTTIRGDFMKDWVPFYEEGKYDFALLHLDQQCLADGIMERGKGNVYRELNDRIQDVPKVVLMHGTPYFPEHFQDDGVEVKAFARRTGDQKMIDILKGLLGSNFMVCNSETAKYQWAFGLKRGQELYDQKVDFMDPSLESYLDRSKMFHIVHGLDPSEWFDLPKEARVVTMISGAGLDAYYDRELLNQVKEGLSDKGVNHCWITVDWVADDWDEYRNFLGRSLIYFNPTREAPMSRSRTEAMLSGCCVVTTGGQDIDRYIKNGENGFLLPKHCDPKLAVDVIMELFESPNVAKVIGEKGREMALKEFHIDRYQDDWYKLLTKIL